MADDQIEGRDGAGVPDGWAPDGIMAGIPALNAAAAQSTLGAVMTRGQMADVDWGKDGPPPGVVSSDGPILLPDPDKPAPLIPLNSSPPGPLTADQIDPNAPVSVVGGPSESGGASGPAGMKISDQGKSFMQSWEQGPKGGVALTPYPSPEGGADTIGWGHKIQPGEDFSDGITNQQADQMFLKDIAGTEKQVRSRVHVPLSQQQYDALVSLGYNSPKALRPGTALMRKLNNSDYAGAADQFQVWNEGGRPRQVMPGLTDRRAGEADIFRNGVYNNHN